MSVIAIISVRGNSKGIKDKNIIPFCSVPLICHTIEKVLRVKEIDKIYVSSDSNKILKIVNSYFSYTLSDSDINYHKYLLPNLIWQPKEISTDKSHSVEAWKYVLGCISVRSDSNKKIDAIVAVQNTSPLCETEDIQKAIYTFKENRYDSLFSACEVRDMFLWEKEYGKFNSITYDYTDRKLRQVINRQYLENGAFYIFKPEVLKEYNNMLGGVIGVYDKMPLWKMFEINDLEDIPICEVLYRAFIERKY